MVAIAKLEALVLQIHNPQPKGWNDATQKWLCDDDNDVHIKCVFTKATCMLKIMLLVDLMYVHQCYFPSKMKLYYLIIFLSCPFFLCPFGAIDVIFTSMDICMDCDIWGCSIGFITIDEI